MKTSFLIISAFVGLIFFKPAIGRALQNPRADSLRNKVAALGLGYLEINDIRYIPAGDYRPSANAALLSSLPAFCRIVATLRPSPASVIKMELWVPQTNWNNRFLGTGNGGGAGGIVYNSLASGIKKGYATANTDMGTSQGVYSAINKPEVWIDFGYRATHLMTEVSKAIVNIYYRKPASYSYFLGCSTGGQQAMMEAQRFPEDYNGIIAGAPANNRTHLHIGFLFNYLLVNKNGEALFTKKQLAFISHKIVSNYVIKSGGAPGDDFLTLPSLVSVDFDQLFKCSSNSADSCLTDEQIDVLKKVYAGPINPVTRQQIYTPPPVGTDNVDLGISFQQTEAGARSLLYPLNWGLGNKFDRARFDFDKDIKEIDSVLAPALNANNSDLSAYEQHGGKLIMYTGTADPLVPYQDALNYYQRVVEHQKGLKRTQSFFRYYLIPGMGHCGGGPGLNGFSNDILGEIVKWVEKGSAPDQLEATAFNCCVVNGPPRFKRPVYPYPKLPKYIGGDVTQPSSFTYQTAKTSKITKPSKQYLN